jgi:membrane-anchored mycosin MYCP
MRLRAMAAASLLGAAVIMLPTTPAWAGCAGVNLTQGTSVTPGKDDSANWVLARFGLNRLPANVDGRGVTVAVLDSGVEANHPALQGRIRDDGRDLLEAGGATKGREDCRGHGTGVATLIAGNTRAGFRGVAPGARILPIRVNETISGDNTDGRKTDDNKIAAAIDYAVDRGADVINLSFAYLNADADPDKHRVFADAVRRAVEKDIVVVAAMGNDKGATDSFPANQEGVIGVAAINADGTIWKDSTGGKNVDVSAPGSQVLAGWPHGIYMEVQGTSFAAPIVAGTAALLKQLHPHWKGSQFITQITATSDPSLGGKGSKTYGAGVIDPVRAVNDLPAYGEAFKNPNVPVQEEDPQAIAAEQRSKELRARALWLALGGVALTIIILLSSSILHNGVRRRWRPAE